MNVRRVPRVRLSFLFAYRTLLYLYPSSFKKRFASEMLQLAEAAEPAEWPLIFGDTSVAVVRCWIQGTRSTPALAEANAYVPLGASRISASVFLPGLVLSILLIAGFAYVNYRWPPPCPDTIHHVTRIVDPTHAAVLSAESSVSK
jgi:hypothetical protein